MTILANLILRLLDRICGAGVQADRERCIA